MNNFNWKKILLKISGESLMGEDSFGINSSIVKSQNRFAINPIAIRPNEHIVMSLLDEIFPPSENRLDQNPSFLFAIVLIYFYRYPAILIADISRS